QGGGDLKKMLRSFLGWSGRGGRSDTNKEILLELDLPPRLRRFKVLRDIYLMAQPPRLIQAGSSSRITRARYFSTLVSHAMLFFYTALPEAFRTSALRGSSRYTGPRFGIRGKQRHVTDYSSRPLRDSQEVP